MKEYLSHALKDGSLVSISDVPNGLACDCFCPNPKCSARLIARKGEKNKHHFAHYRTHDCGGGRESALHIMGKDVIEKHKRIFLPAEAKSEKGSLLSVESVLVEPRNFDGFIPDLLVSCQGREINIEIRVKHAVDAEKRNKLESARLPTIEIDLRDLIDSFTEDTVKNIIQSGERTSWVYSPIIQKAAKAQKAKEALCDFLPNINRLNPYRREMFHCPMLKRNVWFASGSHSCHECVYFDHQICEADDNGRFASMPCRYREKDIGIENAADTANLIRDNGRIVSVEILRGEEWEAWGGSYNGLLTKGYQKDAELSAEKQPQSESTDNSSHRMPSSPDKVPPKGKTIGELWDPNYKWIAVKHIVNGNGMVIFGKNGALLRQNNHPRGMIIGKYAQGDDYRCYRGKFYPVWDADLAVWELIHAKERDDVVIEEPKKSAADGPPPETVQEAPHRDKITSAPTQEPLSLAAKTRPSEARYRSMAPESSTGSTTKSGESQFAKCNVCGCYKNTIQFHHFEGPDRVKIGICKDCYNRQSGQARVQPRSFTEFSHDPLQNN